jgi:hypothetical protein
MDGELLQEQMEAQRKVVEQEQQKLTAIIAKVNKYDRAERKRRQDDRESRQWLNEFTARQAHYHSR